MNDPFRASDLLPQRPMASAAAVATSSSRRVGDSDTADMTFSSVYPTVRMRLKDRLSADANLLHDGVGDTFGLVDAIHGVTHRRRESGSRQGWRLKEGLLSEPGARRILALACELSFAAMFTRSASEVAPIFCITWPLRTFTVISLMLKLTATWPSA